LNPPAIPEQVASVHLIAICGTGMGALAAALKEMGYGVTGSDANVYPPMSTFLENRGIDVSHGFNPANLDYGPDLVIVGNAVRKDNPEAVAMMEAGLPYCSMPQAINHFLAGDKQTVVVCGTHGKTTTASMVAWLLASARCDPSFMIGGIVSNFGTNYRVGKGPYMVIEGDEYDTAFFDKSSKLLHYRPDVVVWTGAEFDHADIFNDIEQIRSVFDLYFSQIPPDRTLIGYGSDPAAGRLLSGRKCRVRTYGARKEDNWRVLPAPSMPGENKYSVYEGQRLFGTFKMSPPGAHNRLNALAAAAALSTLGISAEEIARGLKTFKGVKRRQEVRGVARGVTVIDDFAHHPTAVSETVQAIRSAYPEGRLIAVFEPRTNTSMRKVFQKVYPDAFKGADLICVRKPSLLHKVREDERFSSMQLAEDLRIQGMDAYCFENTDQIIDFVASRAESGDVVLVMSNGGFDNIHIRLIEAIGQRASRQPA
jgi:UDP-N-acetylmuramate: L-alanyl-gamma-D-glutamyl-meso-diaminopimelate ligase